MTLSSRPGRRLLIAAASLATIWLAPVETVAHDVRTALEKTADGTRNEAIVRSAFARWEAGGNVFAGLLAPDVVWTIHGSGPVAGTYHSLQDFIARASAPLVTRLTGPIVPEVHQILADGDTVIIRFDGSATTTSGAPYRNQFVWILRLRQGLVVEAEAFLDLVAYQQVVENNAPRAQ